MPLHLIKLAVGCESIEDLAAWQTERIAEQRRRKAEHELFHRTFQTPKRREELLDGGSLYWVIRGAIQARQRITGIAQGKKDDGSACCLLLLDPGLVAVRPATRRAFQGWRYISDEDVPPDLGGSTGSGIAAMPAAMRKELAELGLL